MNVWRLGSEHLSHLASRGGDNEEHKMGAACMPVFFARIGELHGLGRGNKKGVQALPGVGCGEIFEC